MLKHCKAFVTAESYDLSALYEFLSEKGKTQRVKEVLWFSKSNREAFFFSFGVVVFWGFSHDEMNEILEKTPDFSKTPLSPSEHQEDEFDYRENKNDQMKIHQDQIFLASDKDYLEKIAISYAVAQSVKLYIFENSIMEMIEKTRHIPENLVKTGKTLLSRPKISKIRGELFLCQSSINLNFDLLDTPDFFWEYPEFEAVYQKMSSYLDIRSRIEVMNKKLEVIHDLFDTLSDEQKHQHSSFLEWIIIILILVEIGFTIFHDILSWI